MSRFRPRVSLLSVLVLLTIASMAIVIVQLWRELGPLREEVRRLRDETGTLVVEDPTKLHAIRVDTHDDMLWKWRIWVPAGSAYNLRATGAPIPKDGFPTRGAMMSLHEPGEQYIEYRIDKYPRNDQWRGTLRTRDSSVGSDIHPWVTWDTRTSRSNGVSTRAQTFEPGKKALLLRFRTSQKSNAQDVEDPAEGFMVWLEPAS
jgi:hypothetical protein